ncbi:MAG: YggS family pyridoxal phosphate-dependent enzyme [Treponema sp.]|nr:YggS family pyridoxal phosphate-dependent enzyme [Treponema sp.]
MSQQVDVKRNLETIKNKINDAEIKSGRAPGSVKLMAVSKFHPAEAVTEAINAGQFLFGENRVQEAYSKFPSIIQTNPETELHMIGQLQTNKVRHAVEISSCIESVDRIELISEIEKQCSKINKKIKILFEYHTGEESKSGFTTKDELYKALEALKNGSFPHVIPAGFMTMAPFTDNEALVRKSFITLRELAETIKSEYPMFELNELSMGMSGDFELAIEEGSTLVRIGTAIFGERVY